MVVAEFDENPSDSWFFCRFRSCWCHGLVNFFLVIGVMLRFLGLEDDFPFFYRRCLFGILLVRGTMFQCRRRDGRWREGALVV